MDGQLQQQGLNPLPAGEGAISQPTAPPTPPLAWLRALWPAAPAMDRAERVRVALGVGLGVLLAAAICKLAGANAWLMAPLGASAVLVFALPSSPLAQPWPVVGGNVVSALAGLLVMQLRAGWAGAMVLPLPLWAGVAVSLAVGLMLALRCLHPPGGGTVLVAVLAGSAAPDWQFLAMPVLANSLLLVLAGVLYNRLTGRAYPYLPAPAATTAARFAARDIDFVLARRNEFLDLPRGQLQALLEAAEAQAHRRRLDGLSAAEIMSQPVQTVEFGTPLAQAWELLRQRGVKALPVIDRSRRVVGILTLADFMRHADLDGHADFDERLRRLIRATPGLNSSKPEVVGQLMTRSVRVCSAERSLAELVPVFSGTGHHHLPVIDAEQRLVGILTQTDLVRALDGLA